MEDYRIYTRTEKSKQFHHKINEDRYLFSEFSFMRDEKIKVMMIADGMGGLKDGEKASKNAVMGFSKAFYEQMIEAYISADMEEFSFVYFAEKLQAILKSSIQAANEQVCEGAESYSQTGTTLSVVCIIEDYAIVANVGDSPVYLYQPTKRELTLVSTLQTRAELDAKEGRYERYSEEYYDHEHIIYSSLGEFSQISEEDICCQMIGRLRKGDAFLLGSDGAFGRMHEHEIFELLEECQEEEEEELFLAQLFESARLDKDDDQTAILYFIEGE